LGVREIIEDRRMGALVGAVVGDMLGIPYEFSAPSAIPTGRLMPTGGGPFGFPAGVGSDDTDLLLAIIDSYDDKHEFDPNVAVDKMVEWFRADPRDVGMQTAEALSFWADDMPPPADEYAQGNGGLMRAAAHGIMGKTMFTARTYAADDTRLTHPSDVAADCSSHMAMMVWRLINMPSMEVPQALSVRGPFIDEHKRMMRAYHEDTSKLSGHCVHSLRLAKHIVEDTTNYEDGILRVIRTGGDTDTNAAIAGALLGARYGEKGIPKDWRDAIGVDLRNRIEDIRMRLREKEDA
jgi:ADP-ribosyl-[dinitrogen reductase] hydrolase